jgi:hypothetical protein
MGLVTTEDTVARRRPVGIAATIVLLTGRAALAVFTYLAVGLSVMGTDPCGYMRCGDQQWDEVGVLTAMIGRGWVGHCLAGGSGLNVGASACGSACNEPFTPLNLPGCPPPLRRKGPA